MKHLSSADASQFQILILRIIARLLSLTMSTSFLFPIQIILFPEIDYKHH